MEYNIKKHCDTLELSFVLQSLADLVTMPDAKEKALSIIPETNFSKVKTELQKTDDAYVLISKYSSPTFSSVGNIGAVLEKSRLGASLSMRELLNVAEILSVISSVKKWRESSSHQTEYSIDYLFSALNPNKFLEEKITFAIKSEEEMNDKASTALYDIRRKISSNSAKIRDILEKIVRGTSSKYLQEAIITQRDGRFVVPVKSEYKANVSGIVHDTSASGSTLFIEPMSVVETNNDIRVLKLKEQEEISRILAELSASVSEFADSIKCSYNALIELNLIFAKAKLGFNMRGIIPKLNNEGRVYLKNARHPLIYHKKVVPITVELGKSYNTLVITGPNTGGKTVSLKTIGLLTLMGMCGLMIPADDSSEIAVFDSIFADIGDEQSIEQSLSTFSSHMVNIISILESCNKNSLVLFDELCAGTDPIEGAAIAKAILMKLTLMGVKTVATTHYPELKSYALDTENVENASCEFDVNTLKPTYRLIIGVPGRSNAFAISKRLGLSDEIIESAKQQVSEEDMKFERVVASLEKARFEAEEERGKVLRMRSELESQKKKLDMLDNESQIKQEKALNQARETAARIIDDTRYKSSLLLNELEELKKSFNAENAAKSLEQARAGYKKTVSELEASSDVVIKNEAGEKLLKLPKKNDIVILSAFNADATVIEVNEAKETVYVMSGSMKMWVKLDELRVKKSSKSTEIKKTRRVTGLESKATRSVSGEIDIRGMASDEAIMELDKYIDNAVLSGITTITVIHGKGTGVLRKAVQSHLRSHKNIKTFRAGLFGEGENGVTIAELNQ